MEKTLNTTIGHYFNRLTLTLFVVLGLLGIFAPASQAARFDTTAPTVSLTSPTTGTTFTSAQTVTIAASATDRKGVSKVAFYDGATLLATDTTSPYSFAWAITSAKNGSHSLTAKAYDAAGNSRVSTASNVTINISVQDLTTPTVSLTSPTAGTIFTSAQTVIIATAASDNVGVSKVELYDGANLMATDTASPYSFAWTISTANNGNHSLSAKAYDAAGNSKASSAASVTVSIPVQDLTAPTISLTNPTTGTTLTSAQTVTIAVSASDNVGVSKVELYDGATLKGTDTTAPYSFAWAITSANNGSHSFIAKAYDAAGNVASSTAANINVNIAVATAVYEAPVLNSVTISNGSYLLAWTLPATAYGVPAGGYDIFVDGVDDNLHHTTLSAVKSGLPLDIEHCFVVEARWTQAVPSVFPASNQVCVQGTAPATDSTPPSTRTPNSLRIDPTFTVDSLPGETRLWYNRFWAGIRNPNQYPNATTAAQSNNAYQYGRTLNTHMTSVMQMLRVTGDRQLLDEVDRLAQLMRAQLKDWSILTLGGSTYQTDGYLNWQYNYDAGYTGTDLHVMDEILTHSLVASFAYAFHVNRDLDPRYAERAQFWTNYLKNHFEAKWRKRNNKATVFPFMEKNLTHPYMQFARYHYYMAKLTGDKAYEVEALRMAGNLNNQIKQVTTPIGAGSMWDHAMTVLGVRSLGPQWTHYARYTVQAAADLADEGFSIFGQAGYMDRMAVTLANYVMDGNLSAYAEKIDGSGSGLEPLDNIAISPWAMLGRWDKTGEVQVETERVYQKLESSPENPRRIHLPAGMVYLLSR